MNKTDLLQLRAASDQTLGQVKERTPKLFSLLQDLNFQDVVATITAAFAGRPGLQGKLKALQLEQGDRIALADLSMKILERLKQKGGVSAGQLDDVQEELDDLEENGVFKSPLSDHDALLSDLALVQDELEDAKLWVVGGLAKLDDDHVAKIVDAAPSVSAVDDEFLGTLVDTKVLTPAAAAEFGLMNSLFLLFDEDAALAAAARAERLGSPGRAITAVRDLAVLDAKQWRTLFDRWNVALPSGADRAAYAEVLARRLALLYPSEAFVRRLPAADPAPVVDNITKLAPFIGKGFSVLGQRFDALPTTGLSPAAIEQGRAAHAALSRLVKAYPKFELAAVIEDPNLAVQAKADTVARRVSLVKAVLSKHADKELLFLDYGADSDDPAGLALGTMGMTPDEQRMLLATLKSYQRSHTLAGGVEDAHALHAAGLSSASEAAMMSFDDFKEATGFEESVARKHYDKARTRLGRTTSMAASVMDLVSGGFDKLRVANAGPEAKEMLQRFEGFSDVFGNQNYCKCESCRSILGPAAYFVDLMTFVRESVQPSFKGKDPDHALRLKVRRPDLWHLPLTCENTTTLVPTLDIVNRVLENYIATYQAANSGVSVDLQHRAAVERLVYEDTLAARAATFKQPFVLPLEQLTQYLRHFKCNRATIARALGAARDDVTRTELGLSVIERLAIVTPNPRGPALNQLYDLSFELADKDPKDPNKQPGPSDTLAPVEAEKLLRAMDVTRTELGAIVASRFVQAGAGTPRIVAEKRGKASIQNDVENVRGLSCDTLDRMHRLTRLWRLTAWTVGELDLVLSALDITELAGETLTQLAAVREVRRTLGTSIEQTCTLFSRIPASPVESGGTALVDQLFNESPKTDGSPLPNPQYRFLHPALRLDGAAAKPDPTLPRLLGGLRVTDQDLLGLISNDLHAALGVDPESADEAARSFALSAENLALLYRHARLAELLKLSLPQLFQLLEIVPRNNDGTLGAVKNLADLTLLLEFHAWFKRCGYTLDDVGVILGKAVLDPSAYPEATDLAIRVLSDTTSSSALAFADTLFTTLGDITEEASKALVEALVDSGVLEPAGGDNYRLVPGFDPNPPLTAPPPTLPASEEAIRGVLRGYHAELVLPARLSSALQIAADKLAELIDISGQPLVSPALSNALRVTVAAGYSGPLPAEAQPLVDLVSALLPLTILFKHKAFDAPAIQFVRKHAGAFGLGHLPAADISAIHALSVYARFAPASGDVLFEDDPPRVDVADLRRILSHFAPETGFDASVNAELARLLGTTPRTMRSLREHTALPAPAALALEQIAEAAALAARLGIGGQALAHAVADVGTEGDVQERAKNEYDHLDHATDAVRAAIRAKYPDEEEQEKKLEPYENKLRSLKRDALTDYLMRVFRPAFESRRAISDYFLLDVELEGCARTSRVVSATNSVQLYFQRCLLDLEQDRRGNKDDDPKHVHVRIAKDAIDEWGWRKAYRLWEANRKIFLYPENYLEPELRDDKTPLFSELESQLFQKEIDHQAALDAYAAYVDGLDEVGSLTIAGAYYHEDTETLHLLGVTSADPPTYYYRAVENPFAQKRNDQPLYHAWRKISVQIPVRKASPVIYRKQLYVFWVEIRSQAMNNVFGGQSTFVGYRHKLTLKFSSLRLDGMWTPAQEITLPKTANSDKIAGGVTDYFDRGLLAFLESIKSLAKISKEFGNWAQEQERELQGRLKRIDWTKNPIDDYTLTGPNWDTVYPEPSNSHLRLVLRNFRLVVDVSLFRRKARALSEVSSMRTIHAPKPKRFLLSIKEEAGVTSLYYGSPPTWYAGRNAFANMVLENDRITECDVEYGGANDLKLRRYLHHDKHRIADLNGVTGLLAIPGASENALVQAGRDVLLVERRSHHGNRYQLERLGTTITTRIARKLFSSGVHGLLDLDFQDNLKEAKAPLSKLHRLVDSTNSGDLDFSGPYGVYYRELFFHIPLAIADHLNSRGEFATARRWFHYIFDPTAHGTGSDRVWRYLEFRDQSWPSMRKTLNDERAIQAYERDPFNPHAIARLRPSAYAKSVVMKYIDNLIDWGDSLFRQFTMESVNEATALYSLAADILGDRPYEAADCGEADDALTFNEIQKSLGQGSSFLTELETHAVGRHPTTQAKKVALAAQYALDPDAIHRVLVAAPAAPDIDPTDSTTPTEPGDAADDDSDSDQDNPAARGAAWKHTASSGWAGAAPGGALRKAQGSGTTDTPAADTISASAFGWSVHRQIGPAFCVPPNPELLKYWDRVEDRLYKIHHCLDIHGRRRDLALFAPELDAHLLARMKAAGLSLDDITSATSGDLPPYRFSYLIEKAKSFASTLQSFGSALLSALEKKDGEELNRLRLVHEQNIAKLNTQIKQWEIDAAVEALGTAKLQKEAAEFRREHYDGLLDSGLSAWETMEEAGRHTASVVHTAKSAYWVAYGTLGLLAQIGSPFAQKFGGVELKSLAKSSAEYHTALAAIAESVAASTGLEATFDRRREDWTFQRDLADHEITQLETQIRAAEIRKDIANRSLEAHQKMIEQTEEVHNFYAHKFTNFGLYNWMSRHLQKTYRHAYTNVLSVARLCQAAFQYERDNEPDIDIGADAWDGSRLGLLAGDKLLLELQQMERRFIETNYRLLEIEQSFPLTQLDPAALFTLRETGECTINVPEVFFDLAYPGHYRRRIKAARLTIPCITGPYTNVSATLTLTASKVRRKHNLEAPLESVPLKRTISIATSKAQNDAGVFELTFHDERFMPFEGAGAISTWKLELPKSFRPFDYDTISDVILTLNYTALANDRLRRQVESQNQEAESAILKYLAEHPLSRVFSLRQEFPVTYRALLNSPPGTPVTFEIKDWHFPAFATQRGRRIVVKDAKLAVKGREGPSLDGIELSVDGEALRNFAKDDSFGGLRSQNLVGALAKHVTGEHALALSVAGGFEAGILEDIFVYVGYLIAAP